MTRTSLLGFALVSLALLHCSGDEQSLGANRSGAGQAGSSGTSGQAGAAGSPGGAAGAAGAAPSARRICDGADGLTLGYRVGGGEQVEFERSVSSELGFSYLYVDGHCRFWAYGQASSWEPVHTGTLTAAQEAQLAADLGYSQWDAAHGDFEKPGGSGTIGASVSLFFDRTWRLSCGTLCRDDAPDFVKTLGTNVRLWLDDLYTQGTPATTPMRLQAQEFNGVPEAFEAIPWTLSTPLASVLLSSAQDPVVISEPGDLTALRQLRAAILTHEQAHPGNPGGFYIEQASPLARALVSLRDTIPLEDAQGHVAAP